MAVGTILAENVTNVAAGNIVATDVQAAINELDAEKLSNTGDTATGNYAFTDSSAAAFTINHTGTGLASHGGSSDIHFLLQDGGVGRFFVMDKGIVRIKAIPTSGNVVLISGTNFTDGTATNVGINLSTTLTENGDQTTAAQQALAFIATVAGTGGANAGGHLTGVTGDIRNNQTADTWTVLNGFLATLRNQNASELTNANAYQASCIVSGAGDVITYRGFKPNAPTLSAAGVVVTSVGADIPNMGSAGGTDAYGIRLAAQTTSTNGIGLEVGDSTGGTSYANYLGAASAGVPGTVINQTSTNDSLQVQDSGNTILAVTDLSGAAVKIDQYSNTGAIPVISLDQADIDDSFIDFIGTEAADSSRSISTSNGEVGSKDAAVKIEYNGTTGWLRIYDSAV